MNNTTYKDRGLIKWAPFDALVGIDNLLKEIRYKNNKITRPVLSIDKIDEINIILTKSIYYQTEVLINYFSDGYIKDIYSKVLKIDKIEDKMYLDVGLVIELKDLVDVSEV